MPPVLYRWDSVGPWVPSAVHSGPPSPHEGCHRRRTDGTRWAPGYRPRYTVGHRVRMKDATGAVPMGLGGPLGTVRGTRWATESVWRMPPAPGEGAGSFAWGAGGFGERGVVIGGGWRGVGDRRRRRRRRLGRA